MFTQGLEVQGDTMLHFAAQQGSASMVTWLLKAEANPDARNGRVMLHTNSMHEAGCHCLGDHLLYMHICSRQQMCVNVSFFNVGKQLTDELL